MTDQPDGELAGLRDDYGEDWEISRLASGALIAVRRPRVPGEGSLTADHAAQLREKLDAAQAAPGERLQQAAAVIIRAVGEYGGFRVGQQGLDMGIDADVQHSWVEMALRERWIKVWITEL